MGLQPSVTFLHGKHFQWGFEGSIGLLNAMRQYPEYDRQGSIHLHYLASSGAGAHPKIKPAPLT